MMLPKLIVEIEKYLEKNDIDSKIGYIGNSNFAEYNFYLSKNQCFTICFQNDKYHSWNAPNISDEIAKVVEEMIIKFNK